MRKIVTLTLLMAVWFAMTLNAQVVQTDTIGRAANPNVEIGKAIKTTGVISMSVGLPCLLAGVASLLYAEYLPNPTEGYTTSQAIASQRADMQYITTKEYINKLEIYNGKVRTANNAGCMLTSIGAALTIVGIPLYHCGKRIMTIDVNYTGNGAGLALNF